MTTEEIQRAENCFAHGCETRKDLVNLFDRVIGQTRHEWNKDFIRECFEEAMETWVNHFSTKCKR